MPSPKMNSSLASFAVCLYAFIGGSGFLPAAAFAQSESLSAPAQGDESPTDSLPTTESTAPAPIDPAAEAAAANTPDAAAETSVEVPVAPLANSKALDESSLSNPSGHDEFKRPLLFAPEDNGLQPDNPQIKWEMDAAGKKINLGGLKLSASQIMMKLDQTARSKAPEDIRASAAGSAGVAILSLAWPTLLSKSGTVTVEALDESVTWSTEVSEAMRTDWRIKLARYKSSFLRAHAGSQWGFPDLPSTALASFRGGKPFRVCLTKIVSEIEKLKICTAPHAFKTVGPKRTQVMPVKSTDSANVFLRQKPVGPRGLLNVPLGKEVALKIVFADGEFVEVSSQPSDLDLLDVVESKDGREIILTGKSFQPLGKKKIVERPSSHFWAPTGINQDTIWQVALPKETPTIRILGEFNIPFTFLFRYEKLPTEHDRIFVREATSAGTYSSTPAIFGFSPNKAKIESTEQSVEAIDANRFEWTFAAPTKGARNRSRVTLLETGATSNKWVAHHTLYRGFPFEASARLAGVLSQESFVLLGEVAASAWAETLFGWQNNLLSRQRWGATARYFRTLTSIATPGGLSVSDFSVLNADLKYNLVRGIWNRDQLFGVMGSIEKVSVNGANATLGGVGGYWARTMPRIFSDLFDKFPLLDYSKYVDVEFVFYPMAISERTVAGTSWNLNFHGKVFWTPRVYGEAGFGVRRYQFNDPIANAKIGFETAYGNIGMGLIF